MSKSKMSTLIAKAMSFWSYCAHGVWSDTRPNFSVKLIKTLNITVNSFLNTDLQSKACAMAFRTMLAVVPALALIFAIGRGFGVQTVLQDELYALMPTQKSTIDHALAFVDSYLNRASEGIFIGIGLIFLLYTIITLMINMENTFNVIWNVRERRSLWRTLTDYTAMFLILPVLMICIGGLSVFLSSSLQRIFHFSFMTPILSCLFELLSFAFTSLFFAALFMLFPNTKVHFRNAFISGVITAVGFEVLQWLFVSSQMFVSSYNAIYGSFSIIPLFMLWLQFVWVIIFSGSLICYASQNIFQFSFTEQISRISRTYKEEVTIAIASVIVQNFLHHRPPITSTEIVGNYGIPSRLVQDIIGRLIDVGLVSQVVIDEKHATYGYQPAIDPDEITINTLRQRLMNEGAKNFIPEFQNNFRGVHSVLSEIDKRLVADTVDIKVSELKINLPGKGNAKEEATTE